jgi:hypothetical protein
MISFRISDALLLVAGIILVGWATILSTRSDHPVDQAPSVMAMQFKGVLEGRSNAQRYRAAVARESNRACDAAANSVRLPLPAT